MAERCFSGFEFRKFEPPKPPEAYIYRFKPTDALSTPVEKEIVRLDDLIKGSRDIIHIIVESEPEVWVNVHLGCDILLTHRDESPILNICL